MMRFYGCKTEVTVRMLRPFVGHSPKRILVVGCGSGIEAAVLNKELNVEVIGIDLNPSFDSAATKHADLRKGDATCLRFPDQHFDFVYCYHVLEHIPCFRKALLEISRVLVDGGAYFIGTPNRQRLIGGIGTMGTKGGLKTMRGNLADWKARVRGRFRNELGAHAGFSSRELRTELEEV